MNDHDDEETGTEIPAPSNAEVARWWAQRWGVEAALDPQPKEETDAQDHEGH